MNIREAVACLRPAALAALLARARGTYPRQGLFRDLCRAHGLDRAQRNLLERLAAAQGLSVPARLFLEPERFARAALGPSLSGEFEDVDAIRRIIFAESDLVSA
jgi:hypothetical protein